jgi:hypothetical protein
MRERPLNIQKYKWMYLNPYFHIAKPTNRLKWGLSRADMEMKDDHTEINFYYKQELLKTYTTRFPDIEWVDNCIKKYFDSQSLDIEIKEDDNAPKFKEIREAYKALTNNLR